MSLTNQVAIITGAGGGIGRATALRFAQEGASVVVSDVDEAGVTNTVEQIQAAGGNAVAVIGNVAVRAEAQAVVDAALAQFGKLDILVNNAGITRDALTVRVSDDGGDQPVSVIFGIEGEPPVARFVHSRHIGGNGGDAKGLNEGGPRCPTKTCKGRKWGDRWDPNPRPLVPQTSALTN